MKHVETHGQPGVVDARKVKTICAKEVLPASVLRNPPVIVPGAAEDYCPKCLRGHEAYHRRRGEVA